MVAGPIETRRSLITTQPDRVAYDTIVNTHILAMSDAAGWLTIALICLVVSLCRAGRQRRGNGYAGRFVRNRLASELWRQLFR